MLASTSGRGASLRLASALCAAYAERSGVPTVAELHASKVRRAARRALEREAKHRLVLRKARDRMPEVRMNLPRGLFDAFTAADESGEAATSPPPMPPRARRHYFDARGRLRRGVRDPRYAFLVADARRAKPEQHDDRAT